MDAFRIPYVTVAPLNNRYQERIISLFSRPYNHLFIHSFIAAMAQSEPTLNEPMWVHQEFKQPRFLGDPELFRQATAELRQVLRLHKCYHKPQRWGFAIIRTAYGPQFDDQFAHALRVINRVGQAHCETDVWNVKHTLEWHIRNDPNLANIPVEVDRRPNEELERRFQNDVLQDASLLDNADVSTVRDYFINWIASKKGTWGGGNVRFASCILLDAETLAQLQAVPEGYPTDPVEASGSLYWVKMVEAEPKPVEAFRVRVFGRFGLANYWLSRNDNRDDAINMINESDDNDPSIRYYGEAKKYGSSSEQMAELMRQYMQMQEMQSDR